MKNIHCTKIGKIITFSVDGKMYKKLNKTEDDAVEFYRYVLSVKENPTDENVKEIFIRMNEPLHTAHESGIFEVDLKTKKVYLKGFNTPIPKTLLDIVEDYHKNKFPLTPIVNFWKLLMINPDKRVRNDLFDFISTHDFVLTDEGYMVVYKAVYIKNETKSKSDKFYEFIAQQVLKVKAWKTSPKKYIVYKNLDDKTYSITKKTTADTWNEVEKNIEIQGNLLDLYETIVVNKTKGKGKSKTIYTDMYSKKMTIELGVPVRQARKLCDANPRIDCSNGLHVGATKYVEKFSGWKSGGIEKKTILVCYVNPANVVAVPEYDHSKMRVCEYFPAAIAEYDGTNISIIEQKYFEDDYTSIEKEVLNKMIESVKKDEKPFETSKNASDEDRPIEELRKIIESRIVDLN